MTSKTFDRAGLAISSLCIMHCILLPLAASTLPILGAFSENELIHKVLVLVAIIPAFFAFMPVSNTKLSSLMRSVGLIGISTLFAGAFIESLHDFETILTLVGATCLTSAHALRLLA